MPDKQPPSETPRQARGRRPLSADEMSAARDRVLAAARDLFARDGYRSVSMRALATRISMSPTSLYRFYPNKRAILIHIWDGIFRDLFDACHTRADQAGSPRDAVIAYAICYTEYWVGHPDNYMMVYGEIDRPAAGESFFADSALVQAEMQYLNDLFARCGVSPDALDQHLQQLVCMVTGICHTLVTMPEIGWSDPAALTADMVGRLVPEPG